MSFVERLDSINRVIHPSDALAPVYSAQYGLDEYFRSALRQVDALDALTDIHIGKPLNELRAIADFACHYGRLVRALRVAAPEAQIYACDIDIEALSFCKRELKAQTFYSGWSETAAEIPQVDLLVCVSLFTHTRKAFFEQTIDLWSRMVRPGGLMVFTYLGDNFIKSWEAGEMAHYGTATEEERARTAADFRANGHAFHGYRTPYSETEYGVGFLSTETVKSTLAKNGDLVLLELRQGPSNEFGQDVAIVRRRGQ